MNALNLFCLVMFTALFMCILYPAAIVDKLPHVSTADVDDDEFNEANQLEIRVRRWMDNERYGASDESITAIIHKARVNFASNSECSSYIGD